MKVLQQCEKDADPKALFRKSTLRELEKRLAVRHTKKNPDFSISAPCLSDFSQISPSFAKYDDLGEIESFHLEVK